MMRGPIAAAETGSPQAQNCGDQNRAQVKRVVAPRRQRRARWVSLVLVALGCFELGFLLSCEEELPVYQDPRNVLKGSIRGEYIFSATQNVIRLEFSVVNNFDETFQAVAVLRGDLTVSLRDKPDVKKTIFLRGPDISKGQYNPITGELTMDPGDTVRFSVYWDYTDDQNRDLRNTEFTYITDPSCPLRKIALEEFLVVRGSIKMYDKLNEVSAGPVEVGFCHVNRWVDPHQCTTILPDESCKFLQP